VAFQVLLLADGFPVAPRRLGGSVVHGPAGLANAAVQRTLGIELGLACIHPGGGR
jgi:hypothetical protein